MSDRKSSTRYSSDMTVSVESFVYGRVRTPCHTRIGRKCYTDTEKPSRVLSTPILICLVFESFVLDDSRSCLLVPVYRHGSSWCRLEADPFQTSGRRLHVRRLSVESAKRTCRTGVSCVSVRECV